MKKLLLTLTLLPCLAFANPIQEGVYIGANGKKLSISSYKDDDVTQYDLVVLYKRVGNYLQLAGSEVEPLKIDQSTIFTVPDNPYDDDNPTSDCKYKITFAQNKIYMTPIDSCSNDEKLFSGQYAFSEKSSNLPQKYWSAWGKDCSEPAYIKQSIFSGDGYHSYNLLNFERKGDTLTLYGYSVDEGLVYDHYVHFTPLDNGNMDIEIEYGSDSKEKYSNLPQCPMPE